jgi:hypothetical protein
MQSDVKIANLIENIDRNDLVTLLVPFFSVPQRTEVMLQSRKSIAYIKFGKPSQNVPKGIAAKVLRVT